MSDLQENIMQLMEITGLDRISAENILKINNYNLERAINCHLENDIEYADAGCSTGSNNINGNGRSNNDSSSIGNYYHQQQRYQSMIPPLSSSSSSSSIGSASIAQPPLPSSSAAAASAAAIVDPNCAVSENATLPDGGDGHRRHHHHHHHHHHHPPPPPAPAPAPAPHPNQLHNDHNDVNDQEHNNIRAPIPPKREQLLMPEEDNFRFRKRRAPVFTVCPLRNFAHEAEMQEQQLSWYMENRNIANTTSGRSSPISRNSSRLRQKRSRLDDLFCPPIDLLFWGSFQAAREHSTSQNRWLIVNLQDNSEFKSQILNRDIWPDPELKELILKYFILWQVSVDNAEGLRFKAFYHVENMPYVCIIDPRTGEEKLSCDVVTPQVFRSDLLEFLNANLFSLEPKEQNVNVFNPYKNITGRNTFKSNNITTQKSSTITSSSTAASSSTTSSSLLSSSSTSSSSSTLSSLFTQPATSSSSASFYKNCDYNQMSELSEEDQLELAIKNSLKETQDLSVTETAATATSTTSTTGATTASPIKRTTTITTTKNHQQSSTLPSSATSNDNNSFCGNVLNDNMNDNELQEISEQENGTTNSIIVGETYEKYLGDKNDSQTKIILRLSAGQRVQLEWGKTTKLRAIRLYINSKYPDIAKEPFKLISSFPRQNILELDDQLTLEEAKLHPTAVLHLHPDD